LREGDGVALEDLGWIRQPRLLLSFLDPIT
jgi:hypothetical protein